MKTDTFQYQLPEDLIAQEPADPRDHARMMVVCRRDQSILHQVFHQLPDWLRTGDLLVVNNTRVLPARMVGRKQGSGGKVELLFLEATGPDTWEALLRASRRPVVGSILELGSRPTLAVVEEEKGEGRVVLRLKDNRPLVEMLEEEGLPPLPPYIKRKHPSPDQTRRDHSRYQTVYAREPGAVAAPTAGLHFTEELMAHLQHMGIQRAAVTLHVGPGTFRPVATEDVEAHHMESERYILPPEPADQIRRIRAEGGRIVAVGSTSVRTLESSVDHAGQVQAGQGRTGLFIYPPYTFRAVDVMLTNFHLPRSTLLMMVCAFGGTDLILRAYREAIEEGYRFYSYGDCMLIV